MEVIDSVPPVMSRYEEVVRCQNVKLLPRRPCCQNKTRSLSAPIRSDMDFVGVVFDMRPSSDFLPIDDDELLAKRESMCTRKVTPKERLQWGMDEVRRHGAFHSCHEVVYFPMIFGRHEFKMDFAKYLWLIRSCRAKPDSTYLLQLKRSLLTAAKRFWRLQQKVTINRLIINDSIYCLSWFDHQTRHQIIKILAETFREQREVMWISVENTELPLDDGIRLLLAISIATGFTLNTLHMWHFFRGGLLPIEKDESLDEPCVFQKVDISDSIIKNFFSVFVLCSNYTIPGELQELAFHSAYSCLECLKVLSVEYRYLTGHKGESMLYLGCIRRGNLRELNILFTEYDFVENTKSYVCTAVWKKAYKMCPCFRVNFVAYQVSNFSALLPVMERHMPLQGFSTSTGFKSDGVISLDMLMTRFRVYYKRFLKSLNLHLVRPCLRVDYILSKLLMALPFLEVFIYRGPVDNISSLHAILKYVRNYKLRIKKLHFYLTEDPCQPEPYIKKMNDIYKEYEPSFVGKGIDFKLSTCRC